PVNTGEMRGKKLEFIGMTLAWVILLTVIFVCKNLPLDHQIMLTVVAVLSVYGSAVAARE
ncbi:MAG: hypothetical protein AAF992_27085, partial [Bacteroidota bacterium]